MSVWLGLGLILLGLFGGLFFFFPVVVLYTKALQSLTDRTVQ